MLADNGFRDSYRELYHNELSHPGITWYAQRPLIGPYNPNKKDIQDRIDFIYHQGPSTVLESSIIGERAAKGMYHWVDPWPSDHRALVSTFCVTAVEPPIFIAVHQRLISVGDALEVTFKGVETPLTIKLIRVGKDGMALVEKRIISGTGTVQKITVPTNTWKPGRYQAILFDAAKHELSRTFVWIKKREAQVRCTLAGDMKEDRIIVTWKNAPGNCSDRIGIYAPETGSFEGTPLLFEETKGAITGKTIFDPRALKSTDFSAGNYVMRYINADSYQELCTIPFSIS